MDIVDHSPEELNPEIVGCEVAIQNFLDAVNKLHEDTEQVCVLGNQLLCQILYGGMKIDRRSFELILSTLMNSVPYVIYGDKIWVKFFGIFEEFLKSRYPQFLEIPSTSEETIEDSLRGRKTV